ncbi:MAG: ABC transporter substrate-binding protein [Thermoproteota archaeon]
MQNLYKAKKIAPLLILVLFLAPLLLQGIIGQGEQIRRPVVFVYSMEANFQPEGHFNPYAETGFIWHASVSMYDQLAPHILGTSQYFPELATNWTYDGDWLVVKLRSGVTWHDGQPFTSKDVWSTFMLHKIRGYSEWSSNVIDDVQIVDDYTIKFHVIGLKDLAQNYILSAYINGPYHVFKKYIDEYLAHPENAEAIGVELNKFTPRTVSEGAVGTGPFMLVNMTESDLWLKKFDKFYAADKIVIDYIHGIKEPSNEVGWGYFFSNTADWGEPFSPASVADALTAQGIKVLYAKSTRHDFIIFNWRRPLLSNKLFRQALAYSINRTELISAINYPCWHESKWIIPYSGFYITNWLDQSFLDSLNKYEYNPEKAKAIFAQLGLTYNSKGQLCYANGTVITLYAKFPAPWTDIALLMQNLATQLNRVGITVIPLALDWATVATAETNGDFDIVWDAIGGDHPFLQGFDATAGYGFPTYASFPKVIEWQGKEFNLTQFFIDWGHAKSVDEQKVYVKELAQIYNDYLFALPFADVDAQFYGSKRFIYPPSYDPAWMCTDYARGIIVAQLFFPGKFGLNMSYWGIKPTPPPTTPIETYIIVGLVVVILVLIIAIFLTRRK